MIYLHRTAAPQKVAIPKTIDAEKQEGLDRLVIEGTVSKERFEMAVSVDATELYYILVVELPEGVEAGEYTYNLQGRERAGETGLLQIGTYGVEKEEYEGDVEYVEYRG